MFLLDVLKKHFPISSETCRAEVHYRNIIIFIENRLISG